MALLLMLVSGCSTQLPMGILIPNERPTIELTQVPAPADTLGTYVYEVSWAGFDADGRIASFRYAVDPPTRAEAETAWVATTSNRQTFVFHSDSVAAGGAIRARGFHTVAVQAIDDRGATSPVVHASFTSTTVAPVVAFTSPVPSTLLQRAVGSTLRVGFRGDDPDGVVDRKPAFYRYRLFSESSEIALNTLLADGDTLRRRFAPRFAEWDSLSSDATSLVLRDLTPGQSYVLAMVAFDVAGAFSPVFSASENLLQIRVAQGAAPGPALTLRGPTFEFAYPTGGYFSDPSSWIRTEFAAGIPNTISWSAVPPQGGFVRHYRWAVDLARLDDTTPRSDEETDLSHWSRPTLQPSAVMPRVDPPAPSVSETHTFYLEAEDDIGNLSLAVVVYTAVRAAFDRELLVVDDTWFTPDRAGTGGCVGSPPGVWPSAAELDTFLYAVGGKTWRCYPSGTLSTPGLLAGYAFDTLGTHLVNNDQLSLRVLDRYRNIIWITDVSSAFLFNEPATTRVRPMPKLRDWTNPGVQNPLNTWLNQGGRLWLMGGGAALATLKTYNYPGSPEGVYSASLGELVPGRFMHDWAHWRSEITIARGPGAVRSARAVADDGGVPDYQLLPPSLDPKTLESDPLPPGRPGAVLATNATFEALSLPNLIHESSGSGAFAALDTLYETIGPGEIGVGKPIMTYYHGNEGPPLVFSGFPIWYFQRAQAIQVVDFVLQRVWGLQRRPVPR